MFDINPIIRALIEKKTHTHTEIFWYGPYHVDDPCTITSFSKWKQSWDVFIWSEGNWTSALEYLFSWQNNDSYLPNARTQPRGALRKQNFEHAKHKWNGVFYASARMCACVRVEVVCGSPLKNHNCVKASQKATVYNCKSLYLSQKNRLLKAKWGLNMTQHSMHKDLNDH